MPGITRDGLLPRMSDDAWDEVIDTNLRGAYLCTKFALRSMMNQPWGRIINISSLAGLSGNAGQANYSASKGGLIAFTKSVAREVGSRNITANCHRSGILCDGYDEQVTSGSQRNDAGPDSAKTLRTAGRSGGTGRFPGQRTVPAISPPRSSASMAG